MFCRFPPRDRDVHQLRKDISSLAPAKPEEFMKRLGGDAANGGVSRARDLQVPPPDLSWCSGLLGGRGAQ